MINDIKDLKALFRLCRSQGILEFKMAGVEIKFGDMPEGSTSVGQNEPSDPGMPNLIGFPDRMLTTEELTYYSAGGIPGGPNDPAAKAKPA